MARNTGKPSETSFQEKLTSRGKLAYLYRLKDASDIRGMTGRIGKGIDKTPSDYVAVIDGVTQFAEIKSTIDKVQFRLSNMRAGQSAHGRMIVAAGGNYFVYIHNLDRDEWYRVSFEIVQGWPRSSMLWSELGEYKW